MFDEIVIEGARLHNLKNVSLNIPKNRLVVFTGLSGSGKSTLAFDTLHREGQRQYLESLGMVDYFTKPDVDRIRGLSPSISVDQEVTNRSPRSTVGTATEVFTYLRVLFARIGRRPCPQCGQLLPLSFQTDGDFEWESEGSEREPDEASPEGGETFPCPHCGRRVVELTMGHFSFNKPAGACPECTGLGVVQQGVIERLADRSRSIRGGAVAGWDIHTIKRYVESLSAAGRHYGFAFDPDQPLGEFEPAAFDFLLYGVDSPQFKRHFPNIKPPDAVHRGWFEGIVTNLLRRYNEHADNPGYRAKLSEFIRAQTCPACHGMRLRPESLQVRVMGANIHELAQLSLHELAAWLKRLEAELQGDDLEIARLILIELNDRLQRLLRVGVGYLTLERSSPSLSGGEAQRLRLAALLGSGLTGVLYVLDEPTIGLHPRDTARLIDSLKQLRDLGNTVLVIEHDREMLHAADYLVDIGPGAGKNGGRIVAAGAPQAVMQAPESATGAYLAGRENAFPARPRRLGSGSALTIVGAREHNLKNLTVRFPLGCLTAVTGVSGSGKSSLMFDILDRAAQRRFYRATDEPGAHDAILGWELIDKVITIEQQPIGRVPRSNAATYTDVFTPIRETFAALPEARRRGLEPRHFSFNLPGGRCERCQGSGLLTVKMHFLPDVSVRCPTCRGKRFNREVLGVEYAGQHISNVLDMTIDEALELFRNEPAIAGRLALMQEVGLGYLQLGQPATTLSGGEAQRVKLAKELGRRASGRTLYLLDEPTTGLHMADAARLTRLLQRLVDAGATVIVVEHNLEMIYAADWVIDLGPEGGVDGGELLVEGTPETVMRSERSYTGKFLRAAVGQAAL